MIGRVLGLGAAMGLLAALVVTSEARAEDEDELYYEKESSAYAELSAGASYFDTEDDAKHYSKLLLVLLAINEPRGQPGP